MENRIKKLQNEEDRLNKQIAIAQKHTLIADDIEKRRLVEQEVRRSHKVHWDNIKVEKHKANDIRREMNITNIKFSEIAV